MMRAASLEAEITNKVKERVKEGSSGTVTGEGGGGERGTDGAAGTQPTAQS